MTKDFYENRFDDATQVKLKIFQRYIREWLPVFMTRNRDNRRQKTRINIFDFFAGRGQDAAGNPGSPLIIVEEIKNYCAARKALKADMAVSMVFNDIEESHIEDLKRHVSEKACEQPCCHVEYSSLPFNEVLPRHLPAMKDRSSANLVIMDQFGIKEITPDVVRMLAQCGATDILFFISTSFIRRFIETPEIGKKFDLSVEKLKSQQYGVIHRYLCDHYREKLGDTSYYLAPFSIQKGSNIYGVIFGSSNLLGLEKFLNVCWKLDSVTGEANYNIDGDFSWNRPPSLFEDMNKIRKIDLFEKDLREYIAAHKPDNIALNEFCLAKGFPSSKAKEVLITIQKMKRLVVWDLDERKPARKNSFYLGWDKCKSGTAKVRFTIEANT